MLLEVDSSEIGEDARSVGQGWEKGGKQGKKGPASWIPWIFLVLGCLGLVDTNMM